MKVIRSDSDIPLPERYKNGREGKRKPIHLQALRDYLKEVHDAQEVTRIEADDVLGHYGFEGVETLEEDGSV